MTDKLWQKIILLPSLIIQLGAIGPGLFLIGLAGLGVSLRGLTIAGVMFGLVYYAVAFVPWSFDDIWTLDLVLFLAAGLVGWSILFLVLTD